MALLLAAALHGILLGALGWLGGAPLPGPGRALPEASVTLEKWEPARVEPAQEFARVEPARDPSRELRRIEPGSGPEGAKELARKRPALAAVSRTPMAVESLLPEPGPERQHPSPPPRDVPADPLRMRLPGRAAERARSPSPPADPPTARPGRLDLTFRPPPGALALPGPVTENPGRRDRGGAEPPMADRLIAPKPKIRGAGIFRLTSRGEPEYDGQILRWRSGGSYQYRGMGGTFDAWVGPDGSLAFRDHGSVAGPRSGKPAYAPPLEDPSTPHLKPSGGVVMFTIGTFDVTDAAMRRLGQDPYGAEKKRFAEATSSWREGLRGRFQEATRRRAMDAASLAGPLCRRYEAAEEPRRRVIREELFERWDECREDADGRAVRSALLGSIRRCGIRFTLAELASFNKRRSAREAFSPR